MLRIFILAILTSCFVFSQNPINPNILPYISKKDSLNSIEQLKRDFKAILSRDPIVRANYGVCVYSLDRKEYLINLNENTPLTPASITKLFTTFNALYNFGNDATINTEVWYEDNDIDDKVINNHLYIVGNGDALLSKNDIDDLFFKVKAKGVNKIEGDIMFDLSCFDDETNRVEYSGDNEVVEPVGEISAFSISRKTGEQSYKLIQNSLAQNNISFTGNFNVCKRPETSDATELKLLASSQRPLIDIVNITNKNSDNYLAEHLFKMNASRNSRFKRDYDNSRDLLFSTLDKLKIECPNCDINDGSGLSRRNKVTAKSVVQLLSTATQQAFGKEYYNSLSIASKDGTLRNRMHETSAETYVHAKTGTLRNASGLAGYTTTIDGERLAFAFIFNGNSVGSYKQTENELAELLSGFFYYNVVN